MIDTIKENLVPVGAGIAAIAVFTGAIFMMSNDQQKKKELNEELIKVSELIENKVAIDIREQSTIELSGGFEIDLTAINLKDGTGHINNGEKALDIYSVSNENLAFKTTYNLTDEQLAMLTKEGSEKEIITTLGEVFSDLELSDLQSRDLESMSLGLKDEKDFKNLAKILGPAEKTKKFFKNNDYERTPDVFMPMFSTVDVSEVDGTKTATLTVEGLEFHGKNSPNVGFGIVMGNSLYNATGNASLSYAFGVSMAYSTSFKNNDIYARTEAITVNIGAEHEDMTEEELREYIVNGMLENTIEFESTTMSFSNNFSKNKNKTYGKILDEGRTK